jgi:transposase-like protein
MRWAGRSASPTVPQAAEPTQVVRPGPSQAEVARALDGSRQSVSRWHAGWRAQGTTALRSRGPTGRRPKVADEQLEAIQQALLEGGWAGVRNGPSVKPRNVTSRRSSAANLKGVELANFTGDTVPRSPTRPATASSGSATATPWCSGSFPRPGYHSTRTRHPKVKGSIF